MQDYISIVFDCPNLLGMDLRSSIASIANQSYKKIEIVLGYYGEVIPKPDGCITLKIARILNT